MLVIILDGMHALCCSAATEQLLSIVSEIIIQGLEEFTFLVTNKKLQSESQRLRESSTLSQMSEKITYLKNNIRIISIVLKRTCKQVICSVGEIN